MQHGESFRAMNTDIDLLIETEGFPPLDLFVSVRLLFEQQEQRFSRFRESSLLSALNRGGTIGDPRFVAACRLALDAYDFTSGLYNPMVLPALRDAGYSRSFPEIDGGSPRPQPVPDPRECLALGGEGVRLTAGELDLGGIVKGWTVDLGIELMRTRSSNIFLNAGGDLRCEGSEAEIDGWLVSIADPDGGADRWDGPMRGGLATSTTRKRRWKTASGEFAHHLIDPRTGLPAESPYAQVSVWAEETWRAESWAKAVLIGGVQAAVACERAGLKLLVVEAVGPNAAGR
jgi:thiamine biosynthesis lipoprotein